MYKIMYFMFDFEKEIECFSLMPGKKCVLQIIFQLPYFSNFGIEIPLVIHHISPCWLIFSSTRSAFPVYGYIFQRAEKWCNARAYMSVIGRLMVRVNSVLFVWQFTPYLHVTDLLKPVVLTVPCVITSM